MSVTRKPRDARPLYEVKAQFFKALGHPARVRILEILSEGERSVKDMLPDVGIEPSHLSQQLAVLKRAGLLRARRDGVSIHYAIRDRRIVRLLEVARTILVSSLSETQDLLADLRKAAP